jgi:hypothetical protein
MNAFNGLAMGMEADFSPWGSVILLLLSGVLSFVLAIYLFSWDSRNTTRRGHPLPGLLALVPYAVGIFLLAWSDEPTRGCGPVDHQHGIQPACAGAANPGHRSGGRRCRQGNACR